MTVGSVKALVNGKALTIDAAPLLPGRKVSVPVHIRISHKFFKKSIKAPGIYHAGCFCIKS
uniref:hypothetical protein n=1 Tax=Paenibacillus sp. FSL R7-0189 TaxID=2921673 RepID=UPI00403F18E8